MKLPEEMPRSLLIAPAVMVPGAAIYFSFALTFPEWFFMPLMRLAHGTLFLGLVMGALVLRWPCVELGVKRAIATRLCLIGQTLAFIAAMSVTPI